MVQKLCAIACALFALLTGPSLAQAGPPFQERLPGFDGYCPLLVRPGEIVTFRVSVANTSAETARGTLADIRIPAGLILDEASARVVPGAGAGRFSPRFAASASASTAWVSTDESDEWRSYTFIVAARVANTAAGEQLAVSFTRDSAGKLIRRVDGVVYAKSTGPRAEQNAIAIDMGVPETCKPEPTPTPTPTATPTPTPTPVPPPYYLKRLSLTVAEGVSYSVAVVCVIDPGQALNRPPISEYQITFEAPVGARVALAFGPSPSVAGDGRNARFTARPGGSAVRAVIASRPAAGEAAWQAPVVPAVRVSADGFGDLSERSADTGAACDIDSALAPALVSAERADQAARAAANAAAAEATLPASSAVQASATAVSTLATTPTPTNSPATAQIGPPRPSTPAESAPKPAAILPDPRSIMLPLVCGLGIALGSLAFAFLARRRREDD